MTLFALLAACTPPTATPTPPPTSVPTDTDSVQTGDTGPLHTGDTGPVEPPPIVDCSSPPQGPFTVDVMQSPRAYHGLAFDELGGLVGNDNTSMIRAEAPDDAGIWIPNTGGAEQMDYLPNGDLVVASRGQSAAIVKITPAGAVTVLATGINAYGVEVGPDGMVYTANQDRVHRIDPVNGGADVIIPGSEINVPKVINFNREGTKMYVGTNSSNGNVYEVDLDANYDPIFPVRLIGNTMGETWHDGLGVDACGFLYIAEFWSNTLYRMDPANGDVEAFVVYASSQYGHGIQFGSGVGPWSDHSIFVPQPYNGNTVAEIALGVPSKDFNGGYYDVVY